MNDKPAAVMINIPAAYFNHAGKPYRKLRYRQLVKFLEAMGTDKFPDGCFYHFISKCPVHPVMHAYICFQGEVRYKAIVVEYLKNKPVMLEDYQHPEPRDWIITTGPVVKPPEPILQKGFRGFRYLQEDLF